MNHRERVLSAVNHIEPDRLPTALWGSAYGVTDPLYFNLLKRLKLGDPMPPFRTRKGHTINYYDDRVLEALNVDVRHVDCGFTDLGGPTAGGGLDCWGIRYDQSGIYLSAVDHPLEKSGLDDVENYPWPQVEPFIRRRDVVERARYLRDKTEFAVVGRAFDSYGPFERCCALRGTAAFLLDLAENEGLARLMIQKVTDVLCAGMQIYLQDAGQYLDIIELPGDDYAALRPIISPKMFDHFFAPAWRRIIKIVHEAAPRCKILFHSDGNMEPFLGRLIDLGVNIFHCLEPMPSVDFIKIKQTYGSNLCFLGAIDIKEALQADEVRVAEEVKRRVRQLAVGGGYILAPANHLQPDVSAENVIALFRLARKYGSYPLNLAELED
ncbi:MAG: uroporphyrinogen decarboxylase family protein [Anaerolineaceae bacterium]|nr:uroporphyrinogen decarboxylase family protein [Anaerolineaceae bacterium]